MGSATYCPTCGVKSNPNRVRCNICSTPTQHGVRSNPLYSKVESKIPKAVIFDLDDTILNPAQRFTDAKRAGYIDNKGKPIKDKMMSDGAAWKRRNEFLYSEKSLAKDKPIAGAKTLINKLEKQGYVIIYVTSRPNVYLERIINQLRDNNFPLHQSATGGTLVFARGGNQKSTAYKVQKVKELMGMFRIEMVFDDDNSVLDGLAPLSIPGLYSAIDDYTGFGAKSKPARKNPETKSPNTTSDPNLDLDYDAEPDPATGKYPTVMDTAGQRIFARKGEKEEGEQTSLDDFVKGTEENPRKNPLPKPRKKKMKNGKYRKMNASDYINFLMFRSKKMEEEFPDTGQRYAVALSQVQKHYGNAAKEKVAFKGNPGIKPNPAPKAKVEKGKKLYKHMNNREPEKIETVKLDIGDVWYQVGEGGCWQIGYMSGKEDGNSKQKYNHIFNEEDKDGNFPKLYATMPDKGKPMLIIKDGSWRIEVDDEGVAWIYN